METELRFARLVEFSLELAGSRNIAMLDRHESLGRPILHCFQYMYGVHRAASCGYIDVVEWFVDHGMDLNVLDCDELTFGLVGARFGYFDILHLFLDLGGSEKCLKYFGMNALQRSIFFDEPDAVIFAIVNDAENSSMLTETTSNFGFQACHFAAHFGRLNVLRALVAAGVDPDMPSVERRLTPFHLAAQRGHFEVMKYLHSVDVNVNALSSRDENAAHFAASFGNIDLLRWLDAISVDLYCQAHHRQSSTLTCAVQANHYDCCRYLLEKGIPHCLVDFDMGMDLIRAFCTQNLPIARLLFSYGAPHRDSSDLACACFHPGLLDLCEEFDTISATCGSIALEYQDWDAFDWLVSHGYFSWAQTAFQLEDFAIQVETYLELQRRGFDMHVLNEKGQNLLFLNLPADFFVFFVEEGLDPNVVDIDGKHSFDYHPVEQLKSSLVVVGGAPQLDHQWFVDAMCQMSAKISLPDRIDVFDIGGSARDAAGLRLLAIHAIREQDESLMISVNEKYPLALGAAAIVTEHGVKILKEFGIDIDIDELLIALEERKLTYLINRCREEKMRSLMSMNRMQLL